VTDFQEHIAKFIEWLSINHRRVETEGIENKSKEKSK